MKKSPSVFNLYSRYYDLLYQDKNYAAEVKYIKGLLDLHGVCHGDLLELGSGTGKHGCLLAKLGYHVHGIERSAEMLGHVNYVDGFTCEQGDICSLQLNRSFDAVLALFHVVSYQTTNANLRSVFSSAYKHLQEGGLFIFDFWYSPAVYAQKPSVRIKRIEDNKFNIIRLAEPVSYPNSNRVDVVYTIISHEVNGNEMQSTTETHSMRHFSLPEIELLASIHGFDVIGAEEFLSSKAIGEDTWGICVTLKRL